MFTLSLSASLLEHCQCFPREDVFLIFAPGNVRGNTVPRGSIDPYTPRTPGPGAGSVLDIMISVDHVIQYHPYCQWIPKNTSLQGDEY